MIILISNKCCKYTFWWTYTEAYRYSNTSVLSSHEVPGRHLQYIFRLLPAMLKPLRYNITFLLGETPNYIKLLIYYHICLAFFFQRTWVEVDQRLDELDSRDIPDDVSDVSNCLLGAGLAYVLLIIG